MKHCRRRLPRTFSSATAIIVPSGRISRALRHDRRPEADRPCARHRLRDRPHGRSPDAISRSGTWLSTRASIPSTRASSGASRTSPRLIRISGSAGWMSRTSSTIPAARFRVARSSSRSAGAKFDFVTMVSVATHLPADEIAAYAREVIRLLAPGGRLFLTAFLVAPDDPARDGGPSRTSSRAKDPGCLDCGSRRSPWRHRLRQRHRRIRSLDGPAWRSPRQSRPLARNQSTHYQDIIVAVKAGGGR